MKANNAFRNYIEYIQFPYFRNLDKNTRITFDFPLTVFVGQNGSGKSSTLHALYGAPKKFTPFEFWFSTAVDPIQEVSDGGDRHSFFYVYKHQGQDLEVLKLRILKRNNPDYWETSRPVIAYGMTPLPEGKRNPPVEREVVYLDFRSELSAFDKYFYFKKPRRNLASKNKQEYLRKKSVSLKKIIEERTAFISPAGVNQNKSLITLTTEHLKAISFILGKTYTNGKIIEHKLFEEWGVSIYLQTNFYKYSEAFAGSGEMAVVRLVWEILKAPRYSLILLDEPEVSLHPGAQKRLKQFLLEEIRKQQFQVVISTHSPSIIEELPTNAIKMFSQLPSGKFNVRNEITPEEAFYHLEQTNPAQKTIIVEDLLSKDIINGVLKEMGADTASLFQVNFYTGGANNIKEHFITVYSHSNDLRKFVVFDGDQKISPNHFDPASILEADQTNDRYANEILTQTGVDVKFYPDGNPNDGARADQVKELREQYLKFYLRNVFYMPSNIPEEMIWNQELAENFLNAMNKADYIATINGNGNFKEKFLLLAEAMTGDKKNIYLTEKTFLEMWLKEKPASYNQVVAIITSIRGL